MGDGIWCRKTKRKGLVYGIQYEYNGEKIRETIGSAERDGVTKTMAKKALLERRHEIIAGRFGLPSKAKSKTPKVSELVERYLDQYAKKHKASWTRDDGTLRGFVAMFGKKPIEKVTAWDIQRYQSARLDTGITKASVNKDVAIVRRMFVMAVKWGMLEHNPVSGVERLKEQEKPYHALTHDEQTALIGAAGEEPKARHLQPLVVVALNTGMRRGELLRLTWSDVDLVARLVTVRQSKSGKVRYIPLNAAAVKALRSIQRPEGLVFTHRGQAIHTVRRSFANALRRAKIRPCRFHDLRHTFATNLVLGGVDLVTVQQLMGHADISMTARYTHPTPENKRAAVESLMVAPLALSDASATA